MCEMCYKSFVTRVIKQQVFSLYAIEETINRVVTDIFLMEIAGLFTSTYITSCIKEAGLKIDVIYCISILD